jgi:hypothetical protein
MRNSALLRDFRPGKHSLDERYFLAGDQTGHRASRLKTFSAQAGTPSACRVVLHEGGTMSDALFAKLKDVEPNIANEYKAVVKGNVVGVEELKKIILKVVDAKGPGGSDISSAEAEALVLIIESGELSDTAKRALDGALRTKNVMQSIVSGTAVEIQKDDPELTAFHSIFAIKYTGKIKFYSKGTNLTYAPSHYQAIAQLVKEGKIKVVKVQDRGLSATIGADALYVATRNTFFFFEHRGEANYFSHAPNIVHEATHAVQDWFDVPSSVTVRFVEADAYIAQAVLDTDPKTHKDLKAAAKFVTDGKAIKGNQDWYDAYDAVLALVDRHPLYKDRKDDATDMVEQAGDEPKEFARVLKALSQTAAKPPAGGKAGATAPP